MTAALIRRGLLDRRRALVTWSLSVGVTGAFFMAIWPSIEDSIGEVSESYPAGLKEAFGIGSLSNAEEYLNAELFSLILPFAIAVLALRTARPRSTALRSAGISTCCSASASCS